jgi:uncharacterized membrane protein
MDTPGERRSVMQVLGSLFANIKRLFQDELELAKQEVSHTVAKAGKSVVWLIAGGVAAFIGILAVVAALILALALVLPAWLAALIVGITMIALAGIIIKTHLDKLQHTDFVPHKTIHTLQENVRFIREQVS